MDLEAPGLPDILGVNYDEKKRLGLVPLLHDLEQGNNVDIRDYMVRVEDREIYCLPAGKVNVEYIHLLHQLNFPQYYRFKNNPLAKVFEMLDNVLSPDVILIDARTGFSEINGPLLFDFADLAVITFFPLAEWIEKFIGIQNDDIEKTADQYEKLRILESLKISTGQAEEQDNLVETFIKTKDYFKLLERDTLLVIGRKDGEDGFIPHVATGKRKSVYPN